MKIDRIDHIVLTVRDISDTVAFYTRVLGMEEVRFGEGRTALRFGRQKINLHPHPSPVDPGCGRAAFGSIGLGWGWRLIFWRPKLSAVRPSPKCTSSMPRTRV